LTASSPPAALARTQYRDLLQAAGFTGFTITLTHDAAPGLHSAIIQATKPAAQHA
jgi:arsenite methyltransferase